MTEEERTQALRELGKLFEEDGPDVVLVGARMTADGYYLMLMERPTHQAMTYIDADGVEHETPRPKRCTVNVTREAFEEMLDEWVHGVRVP
jgi:hypothetical protein